MKRMFDKLSFIVITYYFVTKVIVKFIRKMPVAPSFFFGSLTMKGPEMSMANEHNAMRTHAHLFYLLLFHGMYSHQTGEYTDYIECRQTDEHINVK